MNELANKLDALTQIICEDAGNYVVSFLLYEVNHHQGATPEEIVLSAVADAKFGMCAEVTVNAVLNEVRTDIDYKGDESHGPTEQVLLSENFLKVRMQTLAELEVILKNADRIICFTFLDGHPAYPVFWDFAYIIGWQTRSIVFVGSASD